MLRSADRTSRLRAALGSSVVAESDWLTDTRTSYDTVAVSYGRQNPSSATAWRHPGCPSWRPIPRAVIFRDGLYRRLSALK
jgi:hypothetical protein